MSWNIEGQRQGEWHIILVQDLILLNLLQTNDWKRPVYYSATVDNAGTIYDMGLSEFIRMEGLADRITPVRRSWTKRLVDPDRLQRLLLSSDNGFDWDAPRSEAMRNDPHAFEMLKHYVIIFMELAQYRMEVDKSPRMVAQVMQRMDTVLPVDDLVRLYLKGTSPDPRNLAYVRDMAKLFKFGGSKKRYAELTRIIDEETRK